MQTSAGTDREAHLRALADSGAFDVLLIGGGIIGAGCARDLASRGLKVALVEAQDFGQGTTARSTRLVHGGLRYLEQRDFRLVRESLRERERLLRLAPHLVRPLPFLLPVYAGERPNRALLQFGLTLYDVLGSHGELPRHRWSSRAEVLRRLPGLRADDLVGGAVYWDAQVELPERLCWESLLGAIQEGAAIANHVRAVRLLQEGRSSAGAGRVIGAEVRDELAGAPGRSGAVFPIRAHLTVNTTGPWADDALRDLLGLPPERRLLRRTKGVHLVVPQFTQTAVALVAGSDGRVFFVVPWRGFSLVGTTDTDYGGDPRDAAAEADDVAYLQRETRRHFPDAAVDTIFYTWAGVRALVLERSRTGMRESQVSRRDKLHDHAGDGLPGLVTVLGGKITAYRAIAEQLGALTVRILGKGGPSRTATTPFPGTPTSAATHDAALDSDTARTLLHTHGSRAEQIRQMARREPLLARRVVPDAPEILAQLAYAARDEMAVTLADALLRRTAIGFGPRQGLDGLEDAARVMASVHGWDEARIQAEIAAYRREIEPMRRFASPAV